MATYEQWIHKLTEEFSQIKTNYGGLHRELLLCQEEIVQLKKYNVKIREELDERNAVIEDMKDFVGADQVRDELVQVKGDLKDLSQKYNSLEKLTCSRRDLTILEGKVQQTTDSLQSGLDETDNRVDRLHRFFNRLLLEKEKNKAAREESSSSSCGTASGPRPSSSTKSASYNSSLVKTCYHWAKTAILREESDSSSSSHRTASGPHASSSSTSPISSKPSPTESTDSDRLASNSPSIILESNLRQFLRK